MNFQPFFPFAFFCINLFNVGEGFKSSESNSRQNSMERKAKHFDQNYGPINERFDCGSDEMENRKNRTVRIENGLISGVQGIKFSEITVFKGIPFASAPIGELRWKWPQPYGRRFNGTFVADKFAAQCMQLAGLGTNVGAIGSEDCLYLNIWSRAIGQQRNSQNKGKNKPSPNEGRRSPVYVWFYGGGYTFGNAADASFDGEALTSKGIIVVTVNYRVGPFGFLALPSLSVESGRNASSNYGLMDQIVALHGCATILGHLAAVRPE